VPPFHGEQVRLNRWLMPKAKGGEHAMRCHASNSCNRPDIVPDQARPPTEPGTFDSPNPRPLT
jgi:hypothetical protein